MLHLVIHIPLAVFLGAVAFLIQERDPPPANYICFPGSNTHETASLSGEVGGCSIPLGVREMACVFIWPWFHLTHGPPGFNDTLGHRRFRPLTTMFIPMSQPVGKGKCFTPVYTRAETSDNRFLVHICLFNIGAGNSLVKHFVHVLQNLLKGDVRADVLLGGRSVALVWKNELR